jgi:hypothetical protein
VWSYGPFGIKVLIFYRLWETRVEWRAKGGEVGCLTESGASSESSAYSSMMLIGAGMSGVIPEEVTEPRRI